MMSTMLSSLGSSFVLMLTGAMTMVSAFGVYIIFRTAPAETRTCQNRRGPVERQWAKRLMVTVVPAGVIIGLFAASSMGLHFFFIILGFSLLPAGIMAYLDNGKLNRRDQEIAPFLRSWGMLPLRWAARLAVPWKKLIDAPWAP